MTSEEIKLLCSQKRTELLDKYFGNLITEAAQEMPQKIDESKYALDLPAQIENEYYVFLQDILAKQYPDGSKKIEGILDKRHLAVMSMVEDKKQLDSAYKDAKVVTLWEKITKSNNEDVTYYKGLLQTYTEELLKWMELDFIEDVAK